MKTLSVLILEILIILSLWTLAISGFTQTICIDPGHISDASPGCRGKHITEVHANWVIANLLKRNLLHHGYKVVMTKRSEGEVVSNKERAEIANRVHAALFIRLHCDSGSGTGYAIYVPTHIGRLKNGIKGPSSLVIKESEMVASRFHRGFHFGIGNLLRDNGVKGDDKTYIGSKQGALTGSIYSKVPVILIEMLVLTNPHDEEIMLNPKDRNRIAAALCAGIISAIPPTPLELERQKSIKN